MLGYSSFLNLISCTILGCGPALVAYYVPLMGLLAASVGDFLS